AGARPGAPSPGGHAPSSGSTLDPIKLLKQYYPALLLALIVGIGLGTVAHYTLAYLMPSYTATATYECLFQAGDPRDPAPRSAVGSSEMERFMGTQAQVMVSPLILDKAVMDPDFQKTAW